MPKCSYCGEQYQIPRGMTFVKIDGTVVYLCSSKCRKNMLMKRRKVRWITKAKKVASPDVPPKSDIGGKDVPEKEQKEGKKEPTEKEEPEEKVDKKEPEKK